MLWLLIFFKVYVKKYSLILLTGPIALGHTRYSTAGGSDSINTQPFLVHTRHGPIAVAHNGELINADALRQHVGFISANVLNST